MTNAVKHFKWTPRGKRRIHSKPTWREVVACKPWLVEEIRLVRPRIIVCLGATAAQSLLGNDFRLTQHRGEFFPREGSPSVLATIHPSSLLRIPDPETRHVAKAGFLADLKLVAEKLRVSSPHESTA
jgi:DNA polymerase